jgi:hypothetical protein
MVKHLTVLDQTILLALCLDVKNSNPDDGLSGEEMKAFLARVLDHHDDWMVYSTALLESWLEFEQNHGRERAILQNAGASGSTHEIGYNYAINKAKCGRFSTPQDAFSDTSIVSCTLRAGRRSC